MEDFHTLPQIAVCGDNSRVIESPVVTTELDIVGLSEALKGAIKVPARVKAQVLARRREIAEEKAYNEALWWYVTDKGRQRDNELFIKTRTYIWNLVH